MDLVCYLSEGWAPQIRPAPPTRDWMDATPDSFAYRCLPLNVANAHGWEILNPIAFDAVWNGGAGREDLTLRLPADSDPARRPVSLFGSGVLTFHVEGLIRTPPGWNLFVSGSPNAPKDGIAALSGVIETDWSPYSFTMNWRFTRRNHTVRFEAGEPIAFFFPVQRAVLETIHPRLQKLASEPEMSAHFRAWSQSRNEFHATMAATARGSIRPSETWQKRYYRGEDMAGEPVIPDHLSKLRLRPFAPVSPDGAFSPMAAVALQTDTATLGQVMGDLAAAANSGRLESEGGRDALIAQLCKLGLGQSEAIEVLWAAIDQTATANRANDATSTR